METATRQPGRQGYATCLLAVARQLAIHIDAWLAVVKCADAVTLRKQEASTGSMALV